MSTGSVTKTERGAEPRNRPPGRLRRLRLRLTTQVLLLRILARAYLGLEDPDRKRGPDVEPPHREL